MTIKLADYNKALMTIRLDLPDSRAGQSHVVHGRDSVPDHYGTDLLEQAIADGADDALQRKLTKILGI
jgi:hypothetical protein